ncbi:MAG TPA: galactokinase [Pseudonocardiaceae bacterium]|jgi:galactokinase|nr:galactokinase [Pseudonocardiaceae bacterium]
MKAAERAAVAFRDLYGTEPAGIWSAPGRVNLIGEHTDYNDGFVLPFALPHRTAVAAAARPDGLLALTTVGDDGRPQQARPVPVAELAPGVVTGWAAYPAGVAWVLRDRGWTGGADLVIAGNVPAGAGLSSSAALECATLLALLGVTGLPAPDRPELARWAQRAENEFAGVPSGVLDQTASLCCEEGQVLFLDTRSGVAEQVEFAAAAEGLEVLVIDTRANHKLGDGAGGEGYGSRRRGCEEAARLLGVRALRDVRLDELATAAGQLPAESFPLVRHVVTENARVLETVDLLRHNRLPQIGPVLTVSHESLRDDYRVSCPELDAAVDSALAAGALGARMTGAGFGGSAIALVPEEDRPDVERSVLRAFDRRGWQAPRLFTAVPSAGAGRDA